MRSVQVESLLPWEQVDPWYCKSFAVHQRISETQGVTAEIMRMRMICLQVRLFSEAERLHEVDVVPVVTVDPGQAGPPDLHQLVGAEPARVGGLVVEIPVPPLQSGELISYQASECWPCSERGGQLCVESRSVISPSRDSTSETSLMPPTKRSISST